MTRLLSVVVGIGIYLCLAEGFFSWRDRWEAATADIWIVFVFGPLVMTIVSLFVPSSPIPPDVSVIPAHLRCQARRLAIVLPVVGLAWGGWYLLPRETQVAIDITDQRDTPTAPVPLPPPSPPPLTVPPLAPPEPRFVPAEHFSGRVDTLSLVDTADELALTLGDAHGSLVIRRRGNGLTVHHQGSEQQVDRAHATVLDDQLRACGKGLIARFVGELGAALADPGIRVRRRSLDRYELDWNGLRFSAGAAAGHDYLDQLSVIRNGTLLLKLDGRSRVDSPWYTSTRGLATALERAALRSDRD